MDLVVATGNSLDGSTCDDVTDTLTCENLWLCDISTPFVCVIDLIVSGVTGKSEDENSK